MPSPFAWNQLSEPMQERYGAGRSHRRTTIVAVGAVILAFLVVLGWLTYFKARVDTQASLVTWNVLGPDHVHVVVEIHRPQGVATTCVLHATDPNHLDLAYATVTIPAGPASTQLHYELRTLAPAYSVDVLGCASGQSPAVQAPQFPPNVAAPEQPWTP